MTRYEHLAELAERTGNNNLRAPFERAKDIFDTYRPRTAEGRVVTVTDALAMVSVVGAGIKLELAAAKEGQVNGIATTGIALGVGVAVKEIYQHGVVAAIEHAITDPSAA